MKSCKYSDLLSQYIDGQLSSKQTAGLEQHLQICPRCKAELVGLNDLKSKFDSLPEQELPDGLHEAVMKRIRDEALIKRVKPFRLSPVIYRITAPLAAAVLVFLLGRNILNPSLFVPKSANDLNAQESMPAEPVPEPTALTMVGEPVPESTAYLDDSPDIGADQSAVPEVARSEAPEDNQQYSDDGIAKSAQQSIKADQKLTALPGGENTADAADDFSSKDTDSGPEDVPEDKPPYIKYGLIAGILAVVGLGLVKLLKLRR